MLPYTQRSFSSRKNVLGCVHMHFLIGCLLALIFSMQKGKNDLLLADADALHEFFHYFHKVHSTPCGTI